MAYNLCIDQQSVTSPTCTQGWGIVTAASPRSSTHRVPCTLKTAVPCDSSASPDPGARFNFLKCILEQSAAQKSASVKAPKSQY